MSSLSPARSLRGRALAVMAAGAVAVTVAGAAPTVANAAEAPAAPAASCPTGAFAFSSTLSNGTFKIGKNASSTGGKGTACGEITSLNGGLGSLVKKENVVFDKSQTKVLFLNLPTTVKATSDMTGPTVLNADGTIDVSLAGSVEVTTDVLGIAKCVLPLNLNLTTGKSGALTGTPLKSDGAGGFTGKVVAGDFEVPKFASSKSCNSLIATMNNSLLGLPLAKGKSTVVFDIGLKLGH